MNETARLQYITPLPTYDRERPYYVTPAKPGLRGRHNLKYMFGPPQTIRDVRGRESAFSLDTHGFAYRVGWEPPELDWASEEEIVDGYMPRVKELLLDMIGLESEKIKRCEVFDWRLRDVQCDGILEDPTKDRMIKIRAAIVVHVDQSPLGALERIRLHLGQETADELVSKYRVQIFNVWRPLVDVVEDNSLAVCDARTASHDDFLEYDLVKEDFIRRSFLVKFNERFRFYYMSRMTRNDVCVFKIFDSADVRGSAVPHTAFDHQKQGSTSPRQSIEVRLFVMTEY